MMHYFTVLRCTAALALGLLGACSGPSADAPPGTKPPASAKAAVPAPFVGTIRLLEHRTVLGIRQTEYITLILSGPLFRRETRTGGFADSTTRYGIIGDLRSDSVTYFFCDGTQNSYRRLAKADYLASVASDAPISDQPRSYSNIFAPLPALTLHQELGPGARLGKLTDCRAVLFLLPDKSRCDVLYSASVRVPKAVLAYVEHNAPAALPTLALAVHFTPPPAPRSPGLLDRLNRGFSKAFTQSTEFSSLDAQPPTAHDFDLPAGSRPAGPDKEPEDDSGSSSHHSHHFHH